MDRSECRRIVERELPRLVKAFGLGRWRIKVEYGPREGGNSADCTRNLPYDRATIGFDPEQHPDEAELLESLRHELFHLVHAPFDLFYNAAAAGQGRNRVEQLDRLWTFAAEQTVIALEAMYRGLTPPARPERPESDGRRKAR